jgi:hypothetical protein
MSSTQTMIFLNLFLACIARVGTCYSYLTTAMSLVLRIGLHQSIFQGDGFIARETGRRVFWVLRLLCNTMATACIMPKFLNDEDCDQEMPLEVDDTDIEKTRVLIKSNKTFCLTAGSNTYIRLYMMVEQVIRHIYPVQGIKGGSGKGSPSYKINLAKVEKLESELRHWKASIPIGYTIERDKASANYLGYTFRTFH